MTTAAPMVVVVEQEEAEREGEKWKGTDSGSERRWKEKWERYRVSGMDGNRKEGGG